LHERVDPQTLADEPEARHRARARAVEAPDVVQSLQSGRLKRTVRQRQLQDRAPRATILVADVDAEARSAARASLEDVGQYEIVSVGDREELGESLSTDRFPVAIVAERLLAATPRERDGALVELRDRFPRARIILVCDEEPTYKVRRALLALGVFECIARPVEHYGLSSIVDRALASLSPEAAS
ncbi:MAG: hypothetical protein KC466_12730, partial [Myxococcales bacterium]|nr:hypothetical protein [Myxococcales bacterium]